MGAKLKYLTGKPPDGRMYYSIVFVFGYVLTLLQINIAREGWFSLRLFIGGIITAAGARFFNRVLIPKYQRWRIKRRKNNRTPDQQ